MINVPLTIVYEVHVVQCKSRCIMNCDVMLTTQGLIAKCECDISYYVTEKLREFVLSYRLVETLVVNTLDRFNIS